MKIVRYPIVFGVRSVDLGGFVEIIRPSAVDRTLRDGLDVVGLRNHNSDMPLGRVSAGTLSLTKDAYGLRAEFDLNEAVSYASDLLRVIDRGDARGGSFAFRTVDDAYSLSDGIPLREVLDMTVREVSIGVSFPAYPQTAQRAGEPTARSVAWLQKWHRTRLAMGAAR